MRKIPFDFEYDLAVLDFGIFVVASSTHSRGKHSLRLSYVPRVGPIVTERLWPWTTSATPKDILHGVSLRFDSVLAESVNHWYGIEEDLPL